MKYARISIPLLTSLIFCGHLNAAENLNFGADPALWGEEETLYTATKFITQLKTAPAVATIITAQQIENMGARNLLDVLKNVPGITISVDAPNGFINIETRGTKLSYSTNVLLLIDGLAMNDVYYGSSVLDFVYYPVGLIKRVEVIRSPGSALYGTGAFGAVINIITQDSIAQSGSEIALDIGSDEARHASILANQNLGDLKLRAFVDQTQHGITDTYVALDKFGRSGYADDTFWRRDLNLNLSYRDFSLTLAQQEEFRGAYIGVADVLSQNSEQHAEYSYLDARYKKWLSEDLQINFKAWYMKKLYLTDWEIIPAGIAPAFPDGMWGSPHGDLRKTGAEVQADYTFSASSLLTLGVSYEAKEGAGSSHVTNFNPLTGAPLGSIQDITAWGNFTDNSDQYISAVYAQHIWHIDSFLTSTVGARYDEYNNFGGTLNPRFALVWDDSKKTSIKLLYSTAFRAPTPVETDILNNPVLHGNKNLHPEKNKTFELSLHRTLSRVFDMEVNLFDTRISDLIVQTAHTPPNTYVNQGELRVKGVELEVKAKLDSNNYGYANYTFQDPRYRDTNELFPGISRHHANAGLNTRLTEKVNFNTNVNASGRRSRSATDTRPPLDKYLVVDASVIYLMAKQNLQTQLTVHNLLDEDYADPDESGRVPSDFPRPGRSYLLGLKANF